MSTNIEQIVQQYFKDDKSSNVGAAPWVGSIPTPTDFNFAQGGSRSRSFSFAPPSNDGGSPPTSPTKISRPFLSPPPSTCHAFHRHTRPFTHVVGAKTNPMPSSPKMSFSASFGRASLKRSTGNVPPPPPSTTTAPAFIRSSSTPPLPPNSSQSTFVPTSMSGQDINVPDLATTKFLSSLLLPPPLYQFYADDRTLYATSSIRLQQQNDNTRRTSMSTSALPTHNGSATKGCNSPSTQRAAPPRHTSGSLRTSYPSGVGFHSVGTASVEEATFPLTAEEEMMVSPATVGTSRKWPDGSPSPESSFVGRLTLNSFILCSQMRISQAKAARAVCPKFLTIMDYEDAGSAYFSILLFFRNKYGPFANVTHRSTSGVRDGHGRGDSYSSLTLLCGYPFWEKYVKYFPDVYAGFSQPPVYCLLMMYHQLPRKVQKGLDAFALYVEEAHKQYSSSVSTGGAGGNMNTRNPQGMNVVGTSGFQSSPGLQSSPDFFSTTFQEDQVMSPNLTSEPTGFPMGFGGEVPTRNVTPSPAAADDFPSASFQFPNTASTYDDISNAINQLIQNGDRHIALHVILATCRYRPMDRILAAFRHVLSVFPSMKMTTVSLAMNVWRILHCIMPRSTEYTVIAKTLVKTLIQYLHQHSDMASLMTGLVGIRHLAIWESYTYRSLLTAKLDEIILAVWGVLFHANGTVSPSLNPQAMIRIGELAAATLKELFSVALQQGRLHLVQNCVAHAVNCIAGFSMGNTGLVGTDFLMQGKSSNRDASSTTPSTINDTGDSVEKLDVHRNGSQVFPNVSFDMSFSPPYNSSKGGFNDSVGAGISRHNTFVLQESSSIAGRYMTESYVMPDPDFASQILSISLASKEEDHVEAGSLVLSAFLSAWHSSGHASLDALPPNSRSGASMNASTAETKVPSGLPLPLLEADLCAPSRLAGQSWTSFSLKGQSQTGDHPGRRRGTYNPKWSFLTSEKAEFLVPPMNADLFSSRRSSSAKPSPSQGASRRTSQEAKRTKSAPPEVRLSGNASSSSSVRLGGSVNTNKKNIGLEFFLPVEVALQIMQIGINRAASHGCEDSTPLSHTPRIPPAHSSTTPFIEQVFPLLVRAYGSRIPQDMILKATLQVVNRLIRDLKSRNERQQVESFPLGVSKQAEREKGVSSAPGSQFRSESPVQDINDSGPLLRATTLLCAIAPFYPKVFEAVLVNKLSQCFAHTLRYGSPTYNSLAYPALGLIAHNVPQACNTTKCISVIEHLCQLGMSAPFTVVQATVTATIGAALPSFSRSLERFLLRNITEALRSPDEYTIWQTKQKNHKVLNRKDEKDRTPEKGNKGSRNSTPLRSEKTLNFPRSPIKSDEAQLSSSLSYKPLSLYEEMKISRHTPSDVPTFLFPTASFPLNNSLTSVTGSTTTPNTFLPHQTLPSGEEHPSIKKKFMCFHVLKVLGHCWEYTTNFFLENCIDYTHHRDAQLRLMAVRTCITVLLQDCYHEGYRLSTDIELQNTKHIKYCKSSQMMLNQRRSSVDVKNVSSRLARGIQETAASSPAFTFDAELDGEEGVPTNPLDEYVFCDVHTGASHVNTLREIVHVLVDVAVCDPEEHVRLAALKSLGAEVMQFLYPHKRVIDSLFVILNDPGLKNRTEAVRILSALAPQNPIIYRQLRKVFLLKLDHFVKSSNCGGSSKVSNSMLPVSVSNPKSTSRQQRNSPGVIPRSHVSGIESRLLHDESLYPLRIVDEDLSLLIAITGALLNSSPLYLSHLLSMLQRVLAHPPSHSRTTIINVLRLLTQLHDDSCEEDFLLFEPFLPMVARQLMIRDGDTERLLATVAALQSLFQSRMVEYALSKGEQQLTVRWLHSLNYQKPSIGPELSVAILKLLGTISSKESYIASLGAGYNQQLPLLLQRPRDLYEVPRIGSIAAASSAALTFGKADLVLIPHAPCDAQVLNISPHPLKPFSKELWPDAIVRVLMHALLDHINYTSTLTREGIEECLDTILKILLYTDATKRVAGHLVSFLNIYFHLACTISSDHQQLSEAGNFRVFRRLSAVMESSINSLAPIFTLIHSLLLHTWNRGSNIKKLSCCRIIYTLVRSLPGLMRKHAKMWIDEMIGFISNCQALTEEEGLSVVQVYIQEGDDADVYGMNRLFDVEPVQPSTAKWYGMCIITTIVAQTLLTLLPVAPQESIKWVSFRLSYILVSSGVLLSGTDAGGPTGTAASFSGAERSPFLGGQDRSPSSLSNESSAPFRSTRREVADVDDNESNHLYRSRNVLVNHMRYDQIDLMCITRERLASIMNHSICQAIVAYLNATENIGDIAPNVIEQCLQRLHVLAEGHRNVLQVLSQSNPSMGTRNNPLGRVLGGTPRQPIDTRSSSGSSISEVREEEEKSLIQWRQNIGNKERGRELQWVEQSTLQNIEYHNILESAVRRFPFDDFRSSWESCAEIDMLACVFLCFSRGGSAVHSLRQQISNYISFRFGEKTHVSAFFRCATLSTYRCMVLHEMCHGSLCGNRQGSPIWSSAGASSINDSSAIPSRLDTQAPLKAVSSDLILADNLNDAIIPLTSLPHAGSAETLNYDENIAVYSRPCRSPASEFIPIKSAPLPIVGQLYGNWAQHINRKCPIEPYSPLPVSSNNDQIQGPNSPPLSDTTELPEHIQDTHYSSESSENSSIHLEEIMNSKYQNESSVDNDNDDEDHVKLHRQDFLFSNTDANVPLDSKFFFERTPASYQDYNRTDLLNLFEKHLAISSQNMSDWKPWLEHFSFSLVDNCTECCVELCTPLIKKYKFPILSSDLLGVSFLAVLSDFTEGQIRLFLKAFHHFYEIARDIPHNVACEMLRLAHFLRLYGPTVFPADIFKNVVDVEISPAFMVLVAKRALNPTLMMMYLEMDAKHWFTWDTLHLSVSVFDDVLTPFFQNAYALTDPRMVQFLKRENPSTYDRWMGRSITCGKKNCSAAGIHSLKQCPSCIVAHLKQIPALGIALEQSNMNGNLLGLLGYVHTAASRFLASHRQLVHRKVSPRRRFGSFVSQSESTEDGEGLFCPSPLLHINFSEFIRNVLQVMRSYTWVYDFPSILKLWKQVGDLLVLHSYSSSVSVNPSHFSENTAQSSSMNTRDAGGERERDASMRNVSVPAHVPRGPTVETFETSGQYVFSGDTTNVPAREEDILRSLDVMQFAAASSMALSQWDITLEVTSMARRFVHVLQAQHLKRNEYRSSEGSSSSPFPRKQGVSMTRLSTSTTPSMDLENSEDFVDRSIPVLVQMEINRAAALIATSHLMEAKRVLKKVRSLLLEETVYSVFQTEHPRAKLELNCMYQQISDLEEGVENRELTRNLYSVPDIAEERANRRLRNIACRPFTSNMTGLQCFRLLAARSSIVAPSWQLQNILLLSEELRFQGMPMRAAWTLRHFQHLVSQEVQYSPSVKECENELRLERYRLLLKSLTVRDQLVQLQTTILTALRTDSNDFPTSEDSFSGKAHGSATTVPFLTSNRKISVPELCKSMTVYQVNLLLLHLGCRRRIAEFGNAMDSAEASPSPHNQGSPRGRSVNSPLLFSKTKWPGASPPGLSTEGTQQWNSLELAGNVNGNKSSFTPQSPNYNDFTRSSSPLSLRQRPSNDYSDGTAGCQNVYSYESVVLEEYYLLEHAISHSVSSMPAVWCDFGLVLFDICIAMHSEYERTKDPETLQNFHAQSKKAINALQQAARLWKQNSMREEGGIGTFTSTHHPRLRHARSGLPVAHLMNKAFYLANRCEETPLLQDPTEGSPTATESSSEVASAGFVDLNFSPEMYTHWAAIGPLLFGGAVRYKVVCNRLEDMCRDSLTLTYQFLPLLVACFEHNYSTPLGNQHRLPNPKPVREGSGVTCISTIVYRVAEASPVHALAVEETIRMCQFGLSQSVIPSEISLNGACKLPLPVWIQSPDISAVQDKLSTKGSKHQRSSSSDSITHAHDAEENIQNVAGLRQTDGSPSLINRGILAAYRSTFTSTDLSGKKRSETVFTLLLVDGSQMHLHRSTSLQKTFSNSIIHDPASDEDEKKEGRAAQDSSEFFTELPESMSSHMSTPLATSKWDESQKRSHTSTNDWRFVMPYSFMEISINVLLSHLPLLFFRSPFVFPLDLQNYMTQLPERVARNNSWQSSILPATLKETNCIQSSLTPNSISHIQESFDVLQRRTEVANAGLQATKLPMRKGSVNHKQGMNGDSVNIFSTGKVVSSLPYTNASTVNHRCYAHLVSQAFDSGDPLPLLEFLERLLFTLDSTNKILKLNTFKDAQEWYAFQVQLPRPSKQLCLLYLGLREVYPREDIQLSELREMCAEALQESLWTKHGRQRHPNPFGENELSEDCETEGENGLQVESSVESLHTPYLDNEETKANISAWRGVDSMFSNETPLVDTAPTSEQQSIFCGASDRMADGESIKGLKRKVRFTILQMESKRYEDGIKAAFNAEAAYPSQWMEARRSFTQELAEWSLLQYMLDIPERSCDWFFIYPVTGHVATHQLSNVALQRCSPQRSSSCESMFFGSAGEKMGIRERAAIFSDSDEDEDDLPMMYSKSKRSPSILQLLSSPFPTRDACFFRLTKSMEKVLWSECSSSTFLSHLSEGLYEMLQYHRDLTGILRYGLDQFTVWAWTPPSPNRTQLPPSFYHRVHRYSTSSTISDAHTSEPEGPLQDIPQHRVDEELRKTTSSDATHKVTPSNDEWCFSTLPKVMADQLREQEQEEEEEEEHVLIDEEERKEEVEQDRNEDTIREGDWRNGSISESITHVRSETQQWTDRKDSSEEMTGFHTASFLKETVSPRQIPLRVPSRHDETPPKLPRFFSTLSFRLKLQCRAALSRHGDTEESSRKEELQYLARECEENTELFSPQSLPNNNMEESLEEHPATETLSDRCRRSQEMMSERNSGMDHSGRDMKPEVPQLNMTRLLQPPPLDAVTAYDWASLLINIARDELSLIGSEEHPHLWGTWAPHW